MGFSHEQWKGRWLCSFSKCIFSEPPSQRYGRVVCWSDTCDTAWLQLRKWKCFCLVAVWTKDPNPWLSWWCECPHRKGNRSYKRKGIISNFNLCFPSKTWDKNHVSHGKPNICLTVWTHHHLVLQSTDFYLWSVTIIKALLTLYGKLLLCCSILCIILFLFFSKCARYCSVEVSVTKREFWGSLINCGYEMQERIHTLETYIYVLCSRCLQQLWSGTAQSSPLKKHSLLCLVVLHDHNVSI